ncbi:hypothetical protein Agub_g9014, partial [Astrephomene gubernaculifera]
MAVRTVGLSWLEALQFLAEPLDCSPNSTANLLVISAGGRGSSPTAPWGHPLLDDVWRLSCRTQARPAILLLLFLAAAILLVITLRNVCINLVRWYAAARGSAFVAVATAALRELHASGALFAAAAAGAAAEGQERGDTAAAVSPAAAAEGGSGEESTTAAAASDGSGSNSGLSLWVGRPRPPSAHRWYAPPALTAP